MGKKSRKSRDKNKQKGSGATYASAAASGNTASGSGSFLSFHTRASCFERSMKSIPPEDAVSRVSNGLGLSTHIVEFLGTPDAITSHHQYLKRMVDAGLVSVVLGLVNKCREVDIVDIVDTEGGFPFNGTMVKSRGELLEGYVSTPTVWVDILLRLAASEKSLGINKMRICRVEIANGIKPLVECVCDDTKRELFKSTQHWYDVFLPFVTLVYWLIGRKCDPDYTGDVTIPILIEYKGLLETMVRCIFWAQERPDIMQESQQYKSVLKPDNFAQIASWAGAIVEQIMKSHELEDDYKFYYNGTGKEYNMRIGSTLIVDEEYNPECTVPFISGLICLLGGSVKSEVMNSGNFIDRPSLFNMMKMLLVTGCVDKKVINGVMNLGRNISINYEEAVLLVDAAYVMVHDFVPENKPMVPSDTRFGAAIGSGLFEMILELLSRFKRCSNNSQMISHIGMTLQTAQSLISYRQCAKAIELRQESITRALEEYDEDISGVSSNASKCKDIVQMIRSMASMGVGRGKSTWSPCFNCKKLLSQKERKYCTRCHEACYCSRDCQVTHWKEGGHKLACQNRSKREGKKAEARQRNIAEIANKINHEQGSKLLVEATLRGLDILDCVVMADLTEAPLSVKLFHRDEIPLKPGSGSDYEALFGNSLRVLLLQRKVENPITKGTPNSPDLAKSCEEVQLPTFSQGVMKWDTTQNELREHFSYQMDQLRGNPELGVMFLERLKLKYVRKIAEQIVDSNQPPPGVSREQAIDGLVESIASKCSTRE